MALTSNTDGPNDKENVHTRADMKADVMKKIKLFADTSSVHGVR